MALRLLSQMRVGGIIGKFSFDPTEPLARAVLEGMLDAVARRDNAERGIFSVPGVALGWWGTGGLLPRRDEHVPAMQDVRAVAASTITNAAQLRAELSDRYRFRTHSDAELIAHAYSAWGPKCVERLRGPFACAIWDERTRRLTLARDHLGIRPLYFAVLPDHGIVFASELRALLHDPGVGRHWCPEAIDAYLALGYVPAPLTPYGRISKLEPAHLLVVDGRRLHGEQYWDLRISAPMAERTEAIAALDRDLRAAVRRELADGAVNGLLYSGGPASSLLLSATPRTAGTVVTVAIDQDASELARSHAAANTLGRSRELEPVLLPLASTATQLAGHFDEPIADPAAIAQFAVCAAARHHTDTALAAHGAAALWAGAGRHPMTCVWGDFERRAVYTRGFAWHVRDARPLERHLALYAARAAADPAERALYVTARAVLPDSTLAAVERAAAATGLHLRFPFLDLDMISLAATVPAALKRRRHVDMYALRRLLMRTLPGRLLPPLGPRADAHPWLRTALAAMVPTILLAPRFDGRGIVSRPALAQMWDEHRSGRCDHGHRLWAVLMLECWFRNSIDGDAAANEPLEYAVVKVA